MLMKPSKEAQSKIRLIQEQGPNDLKGCGLGNKVVASANRQNFDESNVVQDI